MDRDYIIRILIEARDNVSRAWSQMANDVERGMRRVSSAGRDMEQGLHGSTRELDDMARAGGDAEQALGGTERAMRKTSDALEGLAEGFQGLVIIEVIKHFQQLATVAVALAADLVSLAGSATLAAGAIGGGLAAAFAQAIPAAGLLFAAMERLKAIMDAVKLGQAEQKAAYDQHATAMKNAQNNADQLAAAEYRLQIAHRTLADAQRNLKYQQEQLMNSRQLAIRQLQDLITAEQKAVLAAQGADLGVEQARANLRQIAATGGTGLQVEAAQLQVQQALQSQQDAHRQVTRTQQDLTRPTYDPTTGARVTGINAMPAMLSQTQNMFSANRQLADAEHGVHDAEVALASTRRSIAQATTGATSAQNAYNYALSQLDPIERTVVQKLQRLQAVYKAAMRPITDIIVAEFGSIVDRVIPLFHDPRLMGALRDLAGGLAKGIDIIVGGALSERSKSFWEFMMGQGAKNAPILADAFTQLASALADIARAASPELHNFFVYLDQTLKGWADWTKTHPERLGEIMKMGATAAADWGHLAGAVVRFWLALTGADAKSGNNIVNNITKQFQSWTHYIDTNRGKVSKFFADAAKIGGQVWQVFKTIGEQLAKLWNPDNTQKLVDFIDKVLLPALGDVLSILGDVSSALESFASSPQLQQIAKYTAEVLLMVFALGKAHKAWEDMIGGLAKLAMENPWILVLAAAVVLIFALEQRFHMLRDAWDKHSKGIMEALGRLNDALKAVFGPGGWQTMLKDLAASIGAFADFLLTWVQQVINILADWLKLIGDLIHGRWGKIWDDVKKLFEDYIKAWWTIAKTWLEDMIKFFHLQGVVDAITGAFTGIWNFIKTTFNDITSFFSDTFTSWVNAVKKFGGDVGTAFQDAWNGVSNIVTTVFNDMYDTVRTVVNGIISAINWVITKIGISPIGKLPALNQSTPPGATHQIPHAAEGGIFQPVPGGIYRMVEAGHPEAVIPLDPAKRNRALDVMRQALAAMGKSAWQGDQPPTGSGPIPSFASGGIAVAAHIVRSALAELGLPYVWGSESPGRSFDCSGLVQYAYGTAGISVPRTTYNQWPAVRHPAFNQIQLADMVFSEFGSSGPGHVRLYIGNNKVVAAPHTGTVVQVQPLGDRGGQALGRVLADDKKGGGGGGFWSGFTSALGSGLSTLGSGITGAASNIFGFISDPLGYIAKHLPGLGKYTGLLKQIIGGVEHEVIDGLKKWFVSKLPGFASGGIVTRPTVAMVGEHGPEAIIPLAADGGIFGNIGASIASTTKLVGAAVATVGKSVLPKIPSVEDFLNQSIAQLERDMKGITSKAFGSIKNAAQAMANLLEALDEKIQDLKRDTDKKITALQQQLEVKLLGFNGSLDQLIKGLSSGRLTIQQLAATRAKMTTVTKLQDQLAELKQEFDLLVGERGVIENAIAAITERLKTASGATATALEAELVTLQQMLSDLNAQIISNVQSQMDTTDQILQAQLDAVDNFYNHLNTQLDTGLAITQLLHPFDYTAAARELAKKLGLLRHQLGAYLKESGLSLQQVLDQLGVGSLGSIFGYSPGNPFHPGQNLPTGAPSIGTGVAGSGLTQEQIDALGEKIGNTIKDILQTLVDIFNTYLQGIQDATQRTFTLDDILKQIAELNYDQKGALAALQDEMKALVEEAANLNKLQAMANHLTDQQRYDLKVAQAQNQLQQLELTNAIKELTGELQPQTFSSIAWQWFRQAVFTGMGGLLPQYQIPHFQVGGIVERDGLIYAHRGEAVVPPYGMPVPAGVGAALAGRGYEFGGNGQGRLTKVGASDTVNLYITQPTQVLDMEHLMATLAFEYHNRG